jgi:hypothetical protein
MTTVFKRLAHGLLCVALCCLASCTFRTEPEPLPKGFFALEAATHQAEEPTGWIGASLEMNDADSLESLDIMPGVRVSAVVEGGPAHATGLRVGDVLLSFNGVPTDDPDRLEAMLLTIISAQQAELEIQRGNEVLAAKVQVELKQDNLMHSLYFVDRALLKFAISNDPENGRFPIVTHLANDSSLKRAKVKPGDRILEFQKRDPGSAGELIRRVKQELQPGELAHFVVQSGDEEPRKIKVRAWEPDMVLNSIGLWPVFGWDVDRQENRSTFELGDFILFSIFKVQRVGEVRHWSVLTLFHWETGRPTLLTLEDES